MPEKPTSWLEDHAGELPRGGMALDLACGKGRHALWLAERGYQVKAFDRDRAALSFLSDQAKARQLAIEPVCVDLEQPGFRVSPSAFDVIVVVNYLHRSLFPELVNALRPGGVLIYETFTMAQAQRGRPTNPAFLLEPGELARLVTPLAIVAAREGLYDDREIASIVARRSDTA